MCINDGSVFHTQRFSQWAGSCYWTLQQEVEDFKAPRRSGRSCCADSESQTLLQPRGSKLAGLPLSAQRNNTFLGRLCVGSANGNVESFKLITWPLFHWNKMRKERKHVNRKHVKRKHRDRRRFSGAAAENQLVFSWSSCEDIYAFNISSPAFCDGCPWFRLVAPDSVVIRLFSSFAVFK